jgi:hypothetical protein
VNILSLAVVCSSLHHLFQHSTAHSLAALSNNQEKNQKRQKKNSDMSVSPHTEYQTSSSTCKTTSFSLPSPSLPLSQNYSLVIQPLRKLHPPKTINSHSPSSPAPAPSVSSPHSLAQYQYSATQD